MFLSGNRPLRVNLRSQISVVSGVQSSEAYDLSVEEMFADHDRIDGLRFLECKEGEAP